MAKYKTMLVAKGFIQRPGIDFKEVHAPIAEFVMAYYNMEYM